MQNKIALTNMSNALLRVARNIIFVKKTRKRLMTVLVFCLFSTYFFLNAVPVLAAPCSTGADVTISGACDWSVGTHAYTGTLTIDNSVVVTAGDGGTPGLVVITAEDIVINGTIDADGLGSACSTGTGQGDDLNNGYPGGGGYGGDGGDGDGVSGGITYGSTTEPVDLGSGGGDDTRSGACEAGEGGGAIKIIATGTVTINSTGVISSDGKTPAATGYGQGGGSGGSVWLDAGTLTGDGSITANGSNGYSNAYGGGGGGGRIAVYYDNGTAASLGITAYGGDGNNAAFGDDYGDGGAGTIYVHDGSGSGDLTVANNDALTYHNLTTMAGVTSQTFDSVKVWSGARFTIPNTYSLSLVAGGAVTSGGTDPASFGIESGGTFDPGVTSWSPTFNLVHAGAIATVTDLTVSSTYSPEPTATFSAGLDSVTVSGGGTMSLGGTGTHTYTEMTIEGTLTHNSNTSARSNVLNLSVTDLTVDGGSINLDSKGYFCGDNGYGPGGGVKSGNSSGGGGGGGSGGQGYGSATGGVDNGTIAGPTALGSGGGDGYYGDNCGYGGGAAKITVSDTLTLTSGATVTADGTNGVWGGGGGAGGSIWIDAGTITGTAALGANGGNGMFVGGGWWGGAGGGGRIFVEYDTDDSSSWSYDAYGGTGGSTPDGGAGTVLIKQGSADGDLTVDNNNRDDSAYTNVLGTSELYDSITVNEGAILRVPSGKTLTIDTGGTLTGSGTQDPKVQTESGGTFNAPGTTFAISGVRFHNYGAFGVVTDLTVTGNRLVHDGSTGSFSAGLASLIVGTDGVFSQQGTGTTAITTVTVNSGGKLTHEANLANSKDNILNLSATTLTVNGSGTVDVDAQGYRCNTTSSPYQGYGPGGGEVVGSYHSGGGHGGHGGNVTNAVGGIDYDSITAPVDLGSGGADYSGYSGYNCGLGGGLAQIVVSGTLTNNGGSFTADGTSSATFGGGGAGGSINVTAGTITGTGTFGANGGNGGWGGTNLTGAGGAGGRISIKYTTDSSSSWTYETKGGAEGYTWTDRADGGGGTIYLKQGSADGDLIVDAGDHDDPNYTDTQASTEKYDNITIRNGAQYRIEDGKTLQLDYSGTLTGGGTVQPEMLIDAGTTGGTFDPLGATTFTFLDLDVDHLGHLGTVTDLKTDENWYMFDSDDAAFDAGISTLEVLSNGTFSQMDTGTISIPTVTVRADGDITHETNPDNQMDHKLKLSATTVTVDSSGSIDAEGDGYRCSMVSPFPGYGPGGGSTSGSYSAGGGHGGLGGDYLGAVGGSAYDSVTAPIDLGSGSGGRNSGIQACGRGGGAIRLDVSGTFTNNGAVGADGTNPGNIANTFAGGGAGGSVYVTVDTIAGSGTFKADGGDSAWGGTNTTGTGGAGGRVALHFDNGTTSGHTLSAHGGAEGYTIGSDYQQDGAAGTIFVKEGSANGDLLATNNNHDKSNFTEITGVVTFDNISVDAGAKMRYPSGTTISLDTGGVLDGEGAVDGELYVASGATFNPQSTELLSTGVDVYLDGSLTGVEDLTIEDGDFYFGNLADFDGGIKTLDLNAGAQFVNSSSFALFSGSTLDVGSGATYVHDTNGILGVDTVIVRTNGTITHSDNSITKDASVYISATNMTVEVGGQILVDGLGFDTDLGPGAGSLGGNGTAGGAGYGGDGADGSLDPGTGGGTYPLETIPQNMGSGGGLDGSGGASGGGVIRLVVSGTLTHNGHIGADGNNATAADSGGASGGSIWIDVGTMACGTGTVTADGGDAFGNGGAGGGGRIAITYSGYSGCSPTVLGGTGNTPAGDGTLYATENAPTIDEFTATPSSPTVNDPILVHAATAPAAPTSATTPCRPSPAGTTRSRL